jgi:hypothetical protein
MLVGDKTREHLQAATSDDYGLFSKPEPDGGKLDESKIA